MKTVRWLLEDSKELPLGEAPYGSDIYHALRASDIDVNIDATCQDVLYLLENRRMSLILQMKLDDLVTNVDARYNRFINGWFAFIVAIMCLTIIGVNSYVAITKNEFMAFGDFFFPLLIGGMIVWNRMKILNEGTAKSIGTIISHVKPNFGGSKEVVHHQEAPRVHPQVEQTRVYENVVKHSEVIPNYVEQVDVKKDNNKIEEFTPSSTNPYMK